MLAEMQALALTPRPVAGSVDELLAGVTDREPFLHSDSKSGSAFERVADRRRAARREVRPHRRRLDDAVLR